MTKRATHKLRAEQVLRATVWIQEHLTTDIRIEQVADSACMSLYHFHRVFHGVTGESAYDHIRRHRMEISAHYLKLSPLGVAEIAKKVGYQTHASFTRAFRAHFGMSPNEYRQRFGLPEWLSLEEFKGDSYRRADFSVRRDLRDEVLVERVPKIRVAFVRQYGYYKNIGMSFERLTRWACKKGIYSPDNVFFGLPYDDPRVTPHEKIRFDACMVLEGNVQPEGEFGIQTIGGGDYATAMFTGTAETFENQSQWLNCSYIRRIGHMVKKSPVLEYYFANPMETPPAEMRSMMFLPMDARVTRRPVST